MEAIAPRRKTAPLPDPANATTGKSWRAATAPPFQPGTPAKTWPARWSGAVLMSEQRRDRRMPADYPVTLCYHDQPGRTVTGRVRNISRCGLFVETEGALPDPTPGDAQATLLVRFDLPGEQTGGLRLTARLVHRRADCDRLAHAHGFGLALDRSHPLAAERIRSLLALCQT